MSSVMVVKWMKTGVVIAVLALWVLAVNHCRLELVPGLAFLKCCQHESSEKTAGHHEEDCEDDACAAVEEGLYKAESNPITAVRPTFVVLASFLTARLERDPPALTAHVHSADIPPELPNAWQFAFRTALPPRAPSLVS